MSVGFTSKGQHQRPSVVSTLDSLTVQVAGADIALAIAASAYVEIVADRLALF